MKLRRHDLSGLFGDMSVVEQQKLTADIKQNGLIHPIILLDGQVLDGWHRYNAALTAGVEPRFIEFDGDDRAALARVMSENFKRRHLNEAQRIAIAKQVTGWHVDQARSGQNQHTQQEGVQACTPSKADLAQLADVSERTVSYHNAVERNAPTLLEHVASGRLGLATADKIAKTVEPEVIARSTPEALQAAIATSPEVRCQRMLKAASALAQEWQALALMPATDATEIAKSEVRFMLRAVTT